MMQDWLHHLFFVYLCSALKDRTQTSDIMKKILLLIVAFAMLSVVVSCGDDDDFKRGDGVFTVNTLMINHMFNTNTNEVIGLDKAYNKLVLDTVKHTATLELGYNDGSDQPMKINDITASPKRLGFYELRSASNSQFRGYVDFNEGAMRYIYTTAKGTRVISTNGEVFFLKTNNTIAYDDTTQSTQMENVIYTFTVSPGMDNAIVKVMDIVHAKDFKSFKSITAMSVPYAITANGFHFSGENIPTTARYVVTIDSTLARDRTTTEYPFKTFDADVDLVNDYLDAVYMIGSSATVTATGRTYPDYTSY